MTKPTLLRVPDHGRAALLALAALLAAVAVASPAWAADAPAPCAGTLYTDPAGDQIQDPLGQGDPITTETGQENTDIKSVFLNYAPGADGKPVLTANLKIANLTQDIPDVATGGIYYYLSYNLGDVAQFVTARLTSDGVTYNYGHLGAIPPPPFPFPFFTGYTVDGETTGSFVEGADGVVSIVIPEAVGGKEGASLGAAVATVDIVQYDDESGYQSHADQAPDDAETAKDAAVTACPAAAAPAAPAGATQVVSGVVETTQTAPALTALPFKTATVLGSARKARKPGLRFKASATGAISKLVLQLKTHGKTVGRLKVASLKAGTTTLRMKTRKLRAGSYKLVASGLVDGQALTVTQAVKVRK